MTASGFAWANLPPDLLAVLAEEYGADPAMSTPDQAAMLSDVVGPLPTDDLVKSHWPAIRDQWVLADDQRAHDLAALLDAQGASRGTRAENPESRDFVAQVPNTVRLRAAVIRWWIALGSGAPSSRAAADVSAPPGGTASASDAMGSQAPSFATPENVPYDREFVRSMATGEIAPSSGLDFARLDSLSDLAWMAFAAELFGRVDDLVPGDRLFLEHIGDLAETDSQWARAAMIIRPDENRVEAVLVGSITSPQGVPYTAGHVARLTELGWKRFGDAFVLVAPAEDQVDDLIGALVQALREVLLVTSPTDVRIQVFEPATVDEIPAPPALDDQIFVNSPARAMNLLVSILRAHDASLAPGPDPTQMSARLRSWLVWLHVGESIPTAEIVLVAADGLPDVREDPTLSEFLLGLSTHVLRWTRPVIVGSQLMLAQQVWLNGTSREVIERTLAGSMQDADAAVDAVAWFLSRAKETPEDAGADAYTTASGKGGYL